MGLFLRGDSQEMAGVIELDAVQKHSHEDAGHTHVDSGHTHIDLGHTHVDAGHSHTHRVYSGQGVYWFGYETYGDQFENRHTSTDYATYSLLQQT